MDAHRAKVMKKMHANSLAELVQIALQIRKTLAREDGVSAEVTNSTTDLNGDAVTIVIGGRTYEGTLSEDQNTIAGTVDQEITVGGGDVAITIPAGDFVIDRVDL